MESEVRFWVVEFLGLWYLRVCSHFIENICVQLLFKSFKNNINYIIIYPFSRNKNMILVLFTRILQLNSFWTIVYMIKLIFTVYYVLSKHKVVIRERQIYKVSRSNGNVSFSTYKCWKCICILRSVWNCSNKKRKLL